MKNKSAIALLFLANTISGIAQGISMLAIPWYFANNGDMGRFGLVYAFTTICSLFWVPISGTLVDKYNRKHVFQIITGICGALVIGITALGYYWGILPWFLVAAVFTITFLNYNIHYPCLYAFVQEIVEEKHYGKMTSYLEIQGQLATMLAGAFGALLLEGTKEGTLNLFGFQVLVPWEIAPWEIHDIFLVDACTYLLAFVIISLIQFVPLKERFIEQGNPFQQLKIGYDYLLKNKSVLIFGLASYAIFLTVLLEGFYLGAQYTKAHLEADGSVYAASTMYYSIGALFSGIAIQRIFKYISIPKAIIVLTLLTATLYFVLASTKIFWLYYMMLLLLGITNAGARILRVTFLFRHIPNQVYGRANSIFFLSNVLMRIFFIAIFAFPFFQQGNHVIYTFVVLGIFLVLSALILMYYTPLIIQKNLKKQV